MVLPQELATGNKLESSVTLQQMTVVFPSLNTENIWDNKDT